MTRTVVHGASSKILREEDCNIQDHLRNHVHLTNCIHVKNHLHKYSPNPMSAESALIRDLIVLQRSRSLRDPSTSPSWHSPIADSLAKRLEKGAIQAGRRSVGPDHTIESRTGFSSSPLLASFEASRVVERESKNCLEVGKENDGSGVVVYQNIQGRMKKVGKGKGEASAPKGREANVEMRNLAGATGTSKVEERSSALADYSHLHPDLGKRKTVSKGRKLVIKDSHSQSHHEKSILEQVKEIYLDGEDVGPSQSHLHSRHKMVIQRPGTSGRGSDNIDRSNLGAEFGAFKKRKLKSARISRALPGSRVGGGHNELSLVSDSLANAAAHAKYRSEWNGISGYEENDETELTHAPRNGCGIPWNWSRIHHRGKTFLDMAGRSFSCGLSDSRLRKAEGPSSQVPASPDMLATSNQSDSSARSDSEVLPLLNEPSGSQASSQSAAWVRDYSGELGIYGNQRLKQDRDSDLVSEGRSGDQQTFRQYLQSGELIPGERHRSLTQKYVPKSFMDLVGQNLVSQALSNAIAQKKVGLLYIFYGPHGTGKTSCARVFARALNCQSLEYPRPCGSCNSCIAHELGKSSSVHEVGPVGSLDFENVMEHFEDMVLSKKSSLYRVFIIDDCDSLPSDSWSAISKIIDRAPRRIVFILISTNIDHLPHMIISRCQKFFFPKLRDADIISTLHFIATQENIEIERDAVKLIATRSDGSLRDAEMTLEQLSLLGQRISVSLVQELVGLVSDDKLVDLLDLALSADTVSTVKTLREIMEAGVEPLALMSQLATIITDILAGSYVFTRERLRRKFFRRPTLSKEEMERLRQALKTLSEAEKQLRMSNDRLTWLTAALLQLAPEQQYIVPSSSADTSFNHSPLRPSSRDESRTRTSIHLELSKNRRSNLHVASTSDDHGVGQIPGLSHKDMEEIWANVLEKIQSNTLKQFLDREGQLISVNVGTAPTVKLLFTSHSNKAKAEKFKACISQAFHAVLHFSVEVEFLHETKEKKGDVQSSLAVIAENDTSHRISDQKLRAHNKVPKAGQSDGRRSSKSTNTKVGSSSQGRKLHPNSQETTKNEIVEITASPIQLKSNVLDENNMESAWVEEAADRHQSSSVSVHARKVKSRDHSLRKSLVKGKVSLAHVIQQAESTQHGGRSRCEGISIAEKLEQENLRLEPSSRVMLCWKASKVTLRKLPRLKSRPRRTRSLLKLVPCGRCACSKSPR
ncbi:protein STICHEL-like 3 isoform X2 [Nymphaea colorata]|uniref:protein STICHEL-like 3 isoform X2 n=1 Tax=Nymphaea colorata TaxID=210225 RepID=UPI00129D2A4E|nr:protein STICHEL-like 3 isoform X2 [Nymphaea colorata]